MRSKQEQGEYLRRMGKGLLRLGNELCGLPRDDESGVDYEPQAPTPAISLDQALGDVSNALNRMYLIVPQLEREAGINRTAAGGTGQQ